MKELEQIMKKVFSDKDFKPEQIPALDLYMDQVLTLVNDGLSDNKRNDDEKLFTKTMINNYSKEKLISQIKGKKYTHQHIMQMLCVYQLKQMLILSDVKQLTGREDVDFEACWKNYLEMKDKIKKSIPEQIAQNMLVDLSNPEKRLSLCLALSAVSTYMRRLAESIIDETIETEA